MARSSIFSVAVTLASTEAAAAASATATTTATAAATPVLLGLAGSAISDLLLSGGGRSSVRLGIETRHDGNAAVERGALGGEVRHHAVAGGFVLEDDGHLRLLVVKRHVTDAALDVSGPEALHRLEALHGANTRDANGGVLGHGRRAERELLDGGSVGGLLRGVLGGEVSGLGHQRHELTRGGCLGRGSAHAQRSLSGVEHNEDGVLQAVAAVRRLRAGEGATPDGANGVVLAEEGLELLQGRGGVHGLGVDRALVRGDGLRERVTATHRARRLVNDKGGAGLQRSEDSLLRLGGALDQRGETLEGQEDGDGDEAFGGLSHLALQEGVLGDVDVAE